MTARKKYSREFKQDAVRLVTEQGYDRSEAARNLGIDRGMLARWIKEFQTDDSEAFRGNGKLLKAHGIEGSMSRKGNCWNNAVVESFFGSLKSERVHWHSYQTRQEARADIDEYITMFYKLVHDWCVERYDTPTNPHRPRPFPRPVQPLAEARKDGRSRLRDADSVDEEMGRLRRIVKAFSRYLALTLGAREESGLFPQNLWITLWKKYREILLHNRTTAVVLNRSHFGRHYFRRLFIEIRSIRDC